MPDKIETLILWVDLSCARCNRKIRRVIDKLQDRANIQSVDYNEKENKVIIKGPFDPEWLAKKLCCKACKIIKQYEIVEPPPPPPPPPKEEPKPEPPKEEPKPLQSEPEPPKEEEKPPPPPPKKLDPPPNPCPYPFPYPFAFMPVCCHAPCPCDRGHGGCRCCSCGKEYDEPKIVPPPQIPYYPPPPSQPCCDPCGYRIVYEEDAQTCAVM
ncbi:uncharacterized protein LOC144573999 isoform X2 [Carex rostrata]